MTLKPDELKTIGRVIRSEIESVAKLTRDVVEKLRGDSQLISDKVARYEIEQAEVGEESKAAIKQVGDLGDALQEQLQKFDGRISAIPVPADGKKGEPGDAGTDAPIVDPVVSKPGERYDRNTQVVHNNGLFLATRKTVGDPEEDPLGYRLITSGVKDVSVSLDIDARKIAHLITYSDGQQKKIESEYPLLKHKGKYEKQSYEKFDLVTFNGSAYIALKDTDSEIPSDDWRCFVMRGQRGRAGQPGNAGKPGRKGADGVGIVDVINQDNTLLIELSDGKIKAVNFPLVNEYEDDFDGLPLKTYRGYWRSGETYSAGDVVTYATGLYICKAASVQTLPSDVLSWSTILIINEGAGGGGGGGGWPPVVTAPLNMQNFQIRQMKDPRAGTVGKQDAVNVQTAQKMIAQANLYQGLYYPAKNLPDLGNESNGGFITPAKGTVPLHASANAVQVSASQIGSYFDVSSVFDGNYPFIPTAPVLFDVYFQGAFKESFNLPAKTYADITEVNNEIVKHTFIANNALKLNNHQLYPELGGDWLMLAGLAPEFITALSINGSPMPGGYPKTYTAGVNGKVLNGFNYIVSTADPNKPEYAPMGIPGVLAGTELRNSDILQWAGTATGGHFDLIRGGNLTVNFADGRYWQLTGGNMVWSDQLYNRGAVVLHNNVWWQATQQVVKGTPEPGDPATGAIWRKINSSYGAVTFFGKADFDPSNTTAANNWGMPAGTFPSGQAPSTGDVYFDVASGTSVDFTAAKQPPIYTFTITLDTANAAIKAVTQNEAQGWPGAYPQAVTVGDYYTYLNNTGGNVTILGVAIPDGKTAYMVWSGDVDGGPNADGWAVAYDTGGANWKNIVVTTTHAQAVPDIITGVIVWGTKRNYDLIGPVGVVDDQVKMVIKGIPKINAITRVELRDVGAGGSVYAFTVVSSDTGTTDITPSSIRVTSSHIKELGIGYNATDNIFIWVKVKAAVVGKHYKAIIETNDFSMAAVVSANWKAVVAGDMGKHFTTEADFKPASATRIMFDSNASANNTYLYADTRLSFQMVPTKKNTLYKLIANAALYGAVYADGAKFGTKVFFEVDTFRCIGFSVVNEHIKNVRCIGKGHDFIELELTVDAWTTSGYETLEMNFDMIGVTDTTGNTWVKWGYKGITGITTNPSYTKFPELSIFEIASWT